MDITVNVFDAREITLAAKFMQDLAEVRKQIEQEAMGKIQALNSIDPQFAVPTPEPFKLDPDSIQERYEVVGVEGTLKTEPEPEVTKKPVTVTKKVVTMTDIRAEANKLIKKDRKRMTQILEGFGVEKVSEIPEDQYPDLLEKVVSAIAE